MKLWGLFPFLFYLLLSSSLGDDTVAEDIDVHQLERLVELLTCKECEDLLFALSHPEENIFQHLERLSLEKNQLDLQPRVRREASSDADREAQCRAALTDWLLKYGEQTYYDRLSRALQHIGRTDIAVEVGKNINQDKALSLKRYVEDYHTHVSSLKLLSVQPDTEIYNHTDQQVQRRKVRDLTCCDLDLIVVRAPIPSYQKGPKDQVWVAIEFILLSMQLIFPLLAVRILKVLTMTGSPAVGSPVFL
ncbi:si:ch211-226m16.3 protein [Centroberyx gerrardi]